MTFLEQILKLIHKVNLDVVIIGNSAAALQGVPVTTLDVDFMIRDTESNMKKLKEIASELETSLSKPFEPVSKMMRISTHEIQCDFLVQVDGIKKFESLKSRAIKTEVGQYSVLVANLKDVIKSKKAAGRDKDLATLPILEKTLAVKNKLSELEQ